MLKCSKEHEHFTTQLSGYNLEHGTFRYVI